MNKSPLPDAIIQSLELVEALQEDLIHSDRFESLAHERAFFFCPFGKHYVRQAFDTITKSRIFEQLVAEDYLLLIVITDKLYDIEFPDYVQTYTMSPLPQWPTHATWQSRFFKWSIPTLFPNITRSIYLDSELQATQDKEKVKAVFTKVDLVEFLVSKHQARKNWQDEYDEIERIGRFRDRERLEAQQEFLREQEVPESIPICQTGCLGRLHNSSYRILNQLVLAQLHFLSSRDQLALPYAFFYTQQLPPLIPGGELMYTGVGDSVNLKTLCFIHKTHQHKYMLHYLAKTSFSWIHRYPCLKKRAHAIANRFESCLAYISRYIVRWLSPY